MKSPAYKYCSHVRIPTQQHGSGSVQCVVRTTFIYYRPQQPRRYCCFHSQQPPEVCAPREVRRRGRATNLERSTTHHALRTTHYAPITTHHVPRTTYRVPRTAYHAPRTLLELMGFSLAQAVFTQFNLSLITFLHVRQRRLTTQHQDSTTSSSQLPHPQRVQPVVQPRPYNLLSSIIHHLRIASDLVWIRTSCDV